MKQAQEDKKPILLCTFLLASIEKAELAEIKDHSALDASAADSWTGLKAKVESGRQKSGAKLASAASASSSSNKSGGVGKSGGGKAKIVIKGRGAVDPDSGLDESGHILEEKDDVWTQTLNITDLTSGINSYYVLQLIESDSKGQWWVFRKWGRVGTDIGSHKLSAPYRSKDDAKAEFLEVYLDKTANHWVSNTHTEASGWRALSLNQRGCREFSFDLFFACIAVSPNAKTLSSVLANSSRFRSTTRQMTRIRWLPLRPLRACSPPPSLTRASKTSCASSSTCRPSRRRSCRWSSISRRCHVRLQSIKARQSSVLRTVAHAFSDAVFVDCSGPHESRTHQERFPCAHGHSERAEERLPFCIQAAGAEQSVLHHHPARVRQRRGAGDQQRGAVGQENRNDRDTAGD